VPHVGVNGFEVVFRYKHVQELNPFVVGGDLLGKTSGRISAMYDECYRHVGAHSFDITLNRFVIAAS
jgi:hypothetical protein